MVPETLDIAGVGSFDVSLYHKLNITVSVNAEGVTIDVPVTVELGFGIGDVIRPKWSLALLPPQTATYSGLITAIGDPGPLDIQTLVTGNPPYYEGGITAPWTLPLNLDVSNTLKARAPSGAMVPVISGFAATLSGGLKPGWQCCTFHQGWLPTETLHVDFMTPLWEITPDSASGSEDLTWVDYAYGSSYTDATRYSVPIYGDYYSQYPTGGNCTPDDYYAGKTKVLVIAKCGGTITLTRQHCSYAFFLPVPAWESFSVADDISTSVIYMPDHGGYAALLIWDGLTCTSPYSATASGHAVELEGNNLTVTSPADGPGVSEIQLFVTGCASDLSGITLTITARGCSEGVSASGTTDANGIISMMVPTANITYDVVVNPDTLPFRLQQPTPGTINITPTTQTQYLVSLSMTTAYPTICTYFPVKIPLKNILYLTDSVFGSLPLMFVSSNVYYTATPEFTSPHYTRTEDSVECPARLTRIWYYVDFGIGKIRMWVFYDASFCPTIPEFSSVYLEAAVPLVLDDSMFGSDIVIFRGTRDWSSPSLPANVKKLFSYLYGFQQAEYIVSE